MQRFLRSMIADASAVAFERRLLTSLLPILLMILLLVGAGCDIGKQKTPVPSPTEVVATCTSQALQAEKAGTIAEALTKWQCVRDADPGNVEAATGVRLATSYLQGLTAYTGRDYDVAIAAWGKVFSESQTYADVSARLLKTLVEFGRSLCVAKDGPSIQKGRDMLGRSREIDPNNQEALTLLQTGCVVPTATAVPTPTATATSTPLPVIIGTVNVTDTLRVRSGPGYGYVIVGELLPGATITITGRSQDAAWLAGDAGGGCKGWFASQYVALKYPVDVLSPVSPPALLKSVRVAEAAADFSRYQGNRGWSYLMSRSPGSLDFDPLPWDPTAPGQWYRNPAYHTQLRLSGDGSYPGARNDVARLWVSPYEGTLRIWGQAHKESGAGRGGNGVQVRIVLNKSIAWSYNLGGYDTTGVSFDIKVPVVAGDKIYFVTGAMGDDSLDNTVFSPIIELQQASGVDGPLPAYCPVPSPTPVATAVPPQAMCFQPRLRWREQSRSGYGEVGGIVYDLQGRPYQPWGSSVHIEGPPSSNQWKGDYPVQGSGMYNITALDIPVGQIIFTLWLQGSGIRSEKYEVNFSRYRDGDKLRELVDFYQVVCR